MIHALSKRVWSERSNKRRDPFAFKAKSTVVAARPFR